MAEATTAPETDTGAQDALRLHSDYWMQQRNTLFLASCIALIVTAMSFIIRGEAITALGKEFNLDHTQLGLITGTAFWGFAAAMTFGGPLCDVVGMGRLLRLAMVGHLIGIISTIFATGFWPLFISTLIFGLANGFVEAACNPLIATLYPDQKIKRLNFFHVWFPGGIVIGGLCAYAINSAIGEGHWQLKMATMLLPLAIYTVMFLGKRFPKTERVASGISTKEMFRACTQPFFLLFVACMLMTAVTELGPQNWFPNILQLTTGMEDSVLYLVWITGLMALGRNFAGPLVHRISPIGVLIGSSIFAALGLYLISIVTSAPLAFIAATLFAVGVCFYWPTMLGVVSERFPKTGALGLAIMGGAGMFASGTIQPIIGHTYDNVAGEAAAKYGGKLADGSLPPQALAEGGRAALQQVVALPVILTVIFIAIYMYDKSRGGYKEEVLIQEGQTAE